MQHAAVMRKNIYGEKDLYCLCGQWQPRSASAFFQYGLEVIKLFSCSTQLSMKFVLLINLKLLTIANSFLLNIAEHENSLLINMKMPTIVGIFIFISRKIFMLS